MKNFLSLFILFLFSCSAAKQLNKKWIGKTDQDVVNKFGTPDSVASFKNNGKIYFYNFLSEEIAMKEKSYKLLDENFSISTKPVISTEKRVFIFDSLNLIIKVFQKDTSYIGKSNFTKFRNGRRLQ
jgi:outer membrane protein assembly factor BamE (lipoprotein component of BamABCDE complex)